MYIIIKRRLNDYNRWKEIVAEKDGLRAKYGSKGMTSYRNAADPDEVYLIFEWEDEKPYTDYMNLPEVREALGKTGTFEIIEISETFHVTE